MESKAKRFNYILIGLVLISFADSEEAAFVCRGKVCELNNFGSSSELKSFLSELATFTGAVDLNEITELAFVNSTMEKIPANLFENFPNIQVFSAPGIGLQEIDFDELNSTRILSFLDLSGNNIYRLDLNVFKHIEQLRVVDLSNNVIEDVLDSSKSLPGNTASSGEARIEFFNLDHNQIKKFDGTQLGLQVTELNLNNNGMEDLYFPSSVKVLSVDNNKLKELFIGREMINVSASNNEIKRVKVTLTRQSKFLTYPVTKSMTKRSLY